ncbi:uncharacterized protein HMPREF1541_09613 [Cyphellophora europaea CBS 101466]|uniref:Methyltransferase domain-containing protein n=1 Tax=Cyphellophora europaea (strain CBS 101466) TaxID=1220924 RepID=W2SAX5_CYPE1|nr:uncharacterized protein HMPREF1541_09613 [Cyphellophora europaea CBS 101466]ETN45780.1 hypothetical protein HMPREF1541_09613 [Cyphellophora europaea CBS 101466]
MAAPTVLRDDEHIDVDDDQILSDVDSAIGNDAESYTTSLKSSVLAFKYENGRRYHADRTSAGTVYWAPNDEAELQRLDMHHHIIRLRLGKTLHLAPLADPQRILDIGTGTGIWAIEMGDLYPSAQILGNDLSPVQPSSVPPNVSFEVDDIESDWAYNAPFDYIHSRSMAGSLKDWPRLMRQAFQHTKPGGWVEFQDFEMHWYTQQGEFKPGCLLDKWCQEAIEAFQRAGLEPEPGPKLKQWVEDAGFVNIHHELLPIPIGPWPKDKALKEIGTFDIVQFLENMEGLSMRIFTTLANYTPEEVLALCAKLREELRNPRLQAMHDLHVVYAQKPLSVV